MAQYIQYQPYPIDATNYYAQLYYSGNGNSEVIRFSKQTYLFIILVVILFFIGYCIWYTAWYVCIEPLFDTWNWNDIDWGYYFDTDTDTDTDDDCCPRNGYDQNWIEYINGTNGIEWGDFDFDDWNDLFPNEPAAMNVRSNRGMRSSSNRSRRTRSNKSSKKISNIPPNLLSNKNVGNSSRNKNRSLSQQPKKKNNLLQMNYLKNMSFNRDQPKSFFIKSSQLQNDAPQRTLLKPSNSMNNSNIRFKTIGEENREKNIGMKRNKNTEDLLQNLNTDQVNHNNNNNYNNQLNNNLNNNFNNNSINSGKEELNETPPTFRTIYANRFKDYNNNNTPHRDFVDNKVISTEDIVKVDLYPNNSLL